jgi:hypothetical protein
MEVQKNKPLTVFGRCRILRFLGTSFLAALALGDNGGFKSCSKVVRKGVQFGIAVDFDGLFRGVAYYIAVVAPGKVIFQLCFCAVVNDAVQVVG